MYYLRLAEDAEVGLKGAEQALWCRYPAMARMGFSATTPSRWQHYHKSVTVKPSGNGSSGSSTYVLKPVIQACPLMVGITAR